MAQSYFFAGSSRTSSPGPVSPAASTSSLASYTEKFAAQDGEKHVGAEEVQTAYVEQQNRLLAGIDATKSILTDLRDFTKKSWVVKYPQLHDQQAGPEEQCGEQQADTPAKSPRRKGVRRSLSFADDPTFHADVVVNSPRKGLTRSVTLATIPDEASAEPNDSLDEEGCLVTSAEANDFHVIRLDLKMGSPSSSSSAASLVTQLEKASIANLMDDRISSAVAHMDKLRLRVEDKSSKVLVTGDLNAGKSTFVNALLRRDVMPIDQQPCTTAFCEVHDAAENGGKEELHLLKEGVPYEIHDESTFNRAPISQLEEIISENENVQQMLKVYLTDGRPVAESLVNNGVVDISLIDAPGLNRDSMKTTAVFARQEEIDVVVFVVSAENHFTLSAKEFLFSASNEKAYLFIVVNKYDQIRDKAKCRRLILEQIKQLSPRTYEDAEDLVHFVDSAAAHLKDGTESFKNLEKSLRSFVLVKRSKSKLHPASTFLIRILHDVDLLVTTNAIFAEAEKARAHEQLARAKPVLEKMKAERAALEESVAGVEEAGASRARMLSKEQLSLALDQVGKGKLAVANDKTVLRLPSYSGLWYVGDFVREVRKTLLASIDQAVKLVEDEARDITSQGVEKISQLGDRYLPDGVERPRRVFMPEAMFSAAKDRRRSRRASQQGAVVAGGLHGLGIGLAQRPDLLETTFLDIFDAPHYFFVHFGDGEKDSKNEEKSLTVLSVASVGLSGLALVGSQTVGIRGAVESFFRISNLLGNETARKWAVPVVSFAVLGATAYILWELPRSIPKTVGRRIQASLLKELADRPESNFVDVHATRVSRETRKVLRLAAWDLQERYTAALNERTQEVKSAEDMEKKAATALAYFNSVHEKTGEVREAARLADFA